MRDMGAEHASQGVQLVEHHVVEGTEEACPPPVGGKDAGVEHVGVGQDHVGVATGPRPLLGAAVAVVGRRHDAGQVELPERPQLVLGERFRREQEQRGAARGRGLADRELIAQRLPRRGARRQRHRPPVADQVEGRGLMRPQPRSRDPLGQLRGQRADRRAERRRAPGERPHVDELAVRGQLAQEVLEARTGAVHHRNATASSRLP